MFYDFANLVIRLMLFLFTRTRVTGHARVPTDAPILVVANHLNLLDPPILGALFPRRIAFMGKDELFSVPVVGWVIKEYGAFRVKRGQPDRQAIRTAKEILQSGGAVGIFPEGTRSKTGRMNRAFPGASLLAVLSGCQVIPVGISGTNQLSSPFALLRRPEITISIGEPFRLERSKGSRDDLEQMTGLMMSRVAALLPEERRGYYSPHLSNSSEV